MENFRDSDDIKEALALVGHEMRKNKQSVPTDRDYLTALLLTCRKFSRLDGLLHELKCPAKCLKENIRLLPALNMLAAEHSHFSQIAAEWARRDAQNEKTPKAVVDVEHWLKAACDSSDLALRQMLNEAGITVARIDEAVAGVEQQKVQRTTLFLGKELLEVVGFVLTFLIIIKSLFGELRLIPSESMLPGLKVEDRLVIERVTKWTRPYQRGDVLVFYPPMTILGKGPWSIFMRITGFSGLFYKKEDNVDVAYIKRLIGLPGDRVEVKPGDGVYVNGHKLDEPYVNEIAESCTFILPEPNCSPVTVPQGHYFMMGDNRNESYDSRFWHFARQDRVIGRAVFRIWPVDRIGSLSAAPYAEK